MSDSNLGINVPKVDEEPIMSRAEKRRAEAAKAAESVVVPEGFSTTANPFSASTEVPAAEAPQTAPQSVSEAQKPAPSPVAPAKPAVALQRPERPQTPAPQSGAAEPAKEKEPAGKVHTAVDTEHASRQFLFDLFDDCGDKEVSDLHVHPDRGMWRLTSGILKKHDKPENFITEEEILHWMTHADGYEDMGVTTPKQLFIRKGVNVGHTTVAFDTGTYRIRGSFRESTVGVSATFRLIPSQIPTVEDVYLPQTMIDMIQRKSGLILIEGPTGSGKTTSIAALIDYINKNSDLHIYSIEDPIEFYHEPLGNTVFTMREVGVHASDYPSAVENALRSKPNIIFIGEMLNNETKKSALHASTTGHLVISTAHAGSVTEALDSFIGEFPAEEQTQIRTRLSQSILGVMCQSLIPKKGGGLIAAREIMLADLNIKELVKKGATDMIAAQLTSAQGCNTLEDQLLEYVKAGKIDAKVALDSSKDPMLLKNELIRAGLLQPDVVANNQTGKKGRRR